MSKPVIDKYGNKFWYNDKGRYHNYSPVIDKYGTKRWYNNNGQYHNENGPAIIRFDGFQFWYVNGTWFTDKQSYQKAANLTDDEMIMIILKHGMFFHH